VRWEIKPPFDAYLVSNTCRSYQK